MLRQAIVPMLSKPISCVIQSPSAMLEKGCSVYPALHLPLHARRGFCVVTVTQVSDQ